MSALHAEKRPQEEAFPVPDEVLVERLRRGHSESFNELYDRYFTRVFNFVARRLGNRADTEETVQEVFASIFFSLDSFRGEAPFGAWVFGLTRRTIAGRFKKKLPTTVPLLDMEREGTLQTATREPSPQEICEFNECMDRLEETLTQELSADQRLLFELHHVHKRSIQEIAVQVRKTEDAVKSHLYRARKLMLAR